MTEEERYWLAIFGINKNGPLDIEMTKDLKHSVSKQKEQKRKLFYFEIINHSQAALLRENQIKSWKKSWQSRLIRNANPEWKELEPFDIIH